MNNIGVFGCKMFKSRCRQVVQGFIIVGEVFQVTETEITQVNKVFSNPNEWRVG